MHLTSTVSISLVLFLIGLTCLLLLTSRALGRHVRENIRLSVVIDDAADDDDTRRIGRYLQAAPFVKTAEYISKEEALEELVASLGEDPQEFLGFNPLLASYKVGLEASYANSDSISMIEKKLSVFDHVDRVLYPRDVADLVNDNVRRISAVLMVVAAVLLFVSFMLINNTIRLATYSNRFLINTMKLVGATTWFIRKPYIRQSIRNGLVASLLAIGYLGGLLYYAYRSWGMTELLQSWHTIGAVCAVVVLSGIAITALSAFFSVGRYVRMSTNDLYFV